MDFQGTPIGNSSGGTKVTTDPASNRPIQEGPGPVANDSLAADSVRQGGAFSQNPGSEPLGVSGSKSTFNNTDTSNATKLDPVQQAGDREGPDRKERYPDALGGQGNYPGTHVPETGYTGGSTQAKKDLGIGGTSGQYNTQERQSATAGGSGTRNANQGGHSNSHIGGTAPSYEAPVTRSLGSDKPHGKNISEGGFESNDKNNASFNSEIGSENDPGRLAENKFQRTTQKSAASAGFPKPSIDADQPYGQLNSDQRI